MCRYELLRDNRILRTEMEEFRLRLYEQNEFDAILASCGFVFDRQKAYTGEPVHGDVERIIYVCWK